MKPLDRKPKLYEYVLGAVLLSIYIAGSYVYKGVKKIRKIL